MGDQEVWVHQEQLGLEEQQGNQVFLVMLAYLEGPVELELQGLKVIQDHKVQPAGRETRDLKEVWDFQDSKDKEVFPELLVDRELLV